MRKTLAVVAMGVALALLPGIPAQAATTAPKRAAQCFEQNDPKWDPMRTMADKFVEDGTLTREKADAYKCDPRLVNKEAVKVKVVKAEDTHFMRANAQCTGHGFIVGVGTPEIYTARQSINFCFDGNQVSDWWGECTGDVNGWGKTNFWHYDGCTTNDWIPYTLDGRDKGGIHHRTAHQFTCDVPWVPNRTELLSQWGHYDGTMDWKNY